MAGPDAAAGPARFASSSHIALVCRWDMVAFSHYPGTYHESICQQVFCSLLVPVHSTEVVLKLHAGRLKTVYVVDYS